MYDIALVLGGGSCENDVSIITGLQAFRELDKTKYNVFTLYLTDNKFFLIKNPDLEKFAKNKKLLKYEVFFKGNNLIKKSCGGGKIVAKIDCALLCTHGGIGENGSLQGFFEVCGVPYTSPNVEVSAIGMNKALSKIVFKSLGIDVVPYVSFSAKDDAELCIKNAVEKLGFPIIVKPNAQGSSIGIEVAKDMESLHNAVAVAFEYDSDVILEKALVDFDELNCAAMLNQDDIMLSSLEQPTKWQDYLSFDDKYLGGGCKGAKIERIFPAEVGVKIQTKVHKIALSVYQFLHIKGIVRFDFLVEKDSKKVYLNEINTIPGSLANYLFSDKEMQMKDILDIIIIQSIFEFASRTIPQFKCDLLSKYLKNSVNACKKLAKPI